METTDMQTNDTPPVKRGRGRPRKVPLTTTGGYSGPSLDTILSLSDQQVQIAFDEIQIEPSPFRWAADDDQINVAHWHDYGMTMTDEERRKSVPTMPELRQTAWQIHQENLRMELMAAHLHKWVDSLEDGQLVAQVEMLTDEKLGESAKRYSKRSDLQQRVSELAWPTLIAASTLYVWPTNPLTGKVEDGRSRIPRPNDG